MGLLPPQHPLPCLQPAQQTPLVFPPAFVCTGILTPAREFWDITCHSPPTKAELSLLADREFPMQFQQRPLTAAFPFSEDRRAAGKQGCQFQMTFDLSSPMAEWQLSAKPRLDTDSSWPQREKGREVQTPPTTWGQKGKMDLIC